MLGAPARLVGLVTTSIREWPVRAQRAARRNAMVAATAATARRAERENVAAFLREREPASDDVGPDVRAGVPDTDVAQQRAR